MNDGRDKMCVLTHLEDLLVREANTKAGGLTGVHLVRFVFCRDESLIDLSS